jgi:regulator of protease activity HflC (stomatin/prohibitin superfamily)
VEWGVTIDRVEIKGVSLPETMKRSMAGQRRPTASAGRGVIDADAELQASKKLAEAAKETPERPAVLQLRLLQTVVAVAAEKNSTLVLPFPVELLRFLEKAQQSTPGAAPPVPGAEPPVSGAAVPSAPPVAVPPPSPVTAVAPEPVREQLPSQDAP